MYTKRLLTTTVNQATISEVSDELRNIAAMAIQINVTNTLGTTALTFDSVAQVNTLTFEAAAAMVDGEYVVISDVDGNSWAIAADLTGSSAEPTGAIWTAIPTARKAQVDLSGATDAASVAAAFEVAFDALTGFTAKVVTDDSADDGTMTFTHTAPGVVNAPLSKLKDDSNVGGVTIAETTEGLTRVIDLTADTVTSAAHGLVTGTKVAATTDGTLPTGLSATDYFVIVVDEDTLKLATSLVNANAGTAVNITGYGAGTMSLTPAALAGGSYTVKGSVDEVNYISLGTGYTANITANAMILLNYANPGFKRIRVDFAATAGQYDVAVWMSGVEEG